MICVVVERIESGGSIDCQHLALRHFLHTFWVAHGYKVHCRLLARTRGQGHSGYALMVTAPRRMQKDALSYTVRCQCASYVPSLPTEMYIHTF